MVRIRGNPQASSAVRERRPKVPIAWNPRRHARVRAAAPVRPAHHPGQYSTGPRPAPQVQSLNRGFDDAKKVLTMRGASIPFFFPAPKFQGGCCFYNGEFESHGRGSTCTKSETV